MTATLIDSTLEWIEGDPESPYWQRRQPYWAGHRDGDGTYIIARTAPRQVRIVGPDRVLGGWETVPSVWRSTWHRYGEGDVTYLPKDLATSEDLDVVKAAAVEHHAAGRRANAWAKYMRENDPPEVTQ